MISRFAFGCWFTFTDGISGAYKIPSLQPWAMGSMVGSGNPVGGPVISGLTVGPSFFQ